MCQARWRPRSWLVRPDGRPLQRPGRQRPLLALGGSGGFSGPRRREGCWAAHLFSLQLFHPGAPSSCITSQRGREQAMSGSRGGRAGKLPREPGQVPSLRRALGFTTCNWEEAALASCTGAEGTWQRQQEAAEAEEGWEQHRTSTLAGGAQGSGWYRQSLGGHRGLAGSLWGLCLPAWEGQTLQEGSPS